MMPQFSSGAGKAPLSLASPAFPPNTSIPARYTCKGEDESPPLIWKGAPAETASFLLILKDPDAPHGPFVHWIVYNLPPSLDGVPADLVNHRDVINGFEEGLNSFGRIGYGGPCPPPGSTHHYHFHLYALDAKLKLPPGAGLNAIETAAEGHILASSDFVGLFAR
jgi:Raf kinase inhibitor-like YbhB/YbcL family protein